MLRDDIECVITIPVYDLHDMSEDEFKAQLIYNKLVARAVICIDFRDLNGQLFKNIKQQYLQKSFKDELKDTLAIFCYNVSKSLKESSRLNGV